MQTQKVETTQDFNKFAKKISLSDETLEKIKEWAYSFTFTISPRSDRPFRSPRGKVEVWEIRVPNPDKKAGTSGGYRMLCFFVAEEETMFLDFIAERDTLNKPKEKQNYNAYLKKLKSYVQKTYDPR